MKAEYFPPKEDVILQNDAPTDFYILVTGAVNLVIHKNGLEQVVREAKAGDVFGEVRVLCYKMQLFNVRTKRLSQLLRLNRAVFFNIVQANVRDGTIIMNNLLQHLKELNDPEMEVVLTETENMLAQGGDNLLLHQLLRRGLDPNESNDSERIALHIAASKGYENCVLLLLDCGADPNSRDLPRVWVPKQPKSVAAKHESLWKLPKKKKWQEVSYEVVCETPIVEKKCGSY
ncbi:hypothetical protein NE237_032257 [Protea cynaroides]|uniref:Potassium channel n=1 Tax=Protea cynaroides TaxID=273540 RepID=A0A9Q0R3D2_9MAGN|nr:hypothetical protein NE237_032257 [Protea cynaroides]